MILLRVGCGLCLLRVWGVERGLSQPLEPGRMKAGLESFSVPQHANHDKTRRGVYERGSSVQVDVMTKHPLPNDRLGCPRLLDGGPSFQKKRTYFCS